MQLKCFSHWKNGEIIKAKPLEFRQGTRHFSKFTIQIGPFFRMRTIECADHYHRRFKHGEGFASETGGNFEERAAYHKMQSFGVC